MPVATTPRTTANSLRASKRSKPNNTTTTRLRNLTEDQANTWSKALSKRSSEYQQDGFPEDDDEYPFKDQDRVWVRTKEEKWCAGKVSGGGAGHGGQLSIRTGRTRYRKEGLFYPVRFGGKLHIRKYFAPTNGEIKPDTKAVRKILFKDGWIASGDEDGRSDSIAAASDLSDGSYHDVD